MLLTVDRIDAGLAVLVDAEGEEATIPRAWLSDDVREGAAVRLERDPDAQLEIRKRIAAHQKRFSDEDFDL